MGYETSASSTVRRFRPSGASGPVVVLVGQTPAVWLASSAQPRACVEVGRWAYCADPADTTDIDDILTAAAGADTDIVSIVAHGDGCQVALDWALDQPDRVAAMALVAPNATLAQAAGYVARDVIGDRAPGGTRVKVWHETGDTAAATLAAQLGAATGTLADPDPIDAPTTVIADLLDVADAWGNAAGLAQIARWDDYIRANPSQTDPALYRGGDGCASVVLPDGRTLWAFGDTWVGTVDADHTFGSTSPLVNNSVVIETAGALSSQLYAAGTTGPAIVPAEGGTWYWLGTGIVVGGQLIMLATHVTTGDPATVLDRRLLTIDPADLSVDATTSGLADLFDVDEIILDGPWVYIYGFRDPDSTVVARAPAATLTTLSTWRFWDGDNWALDADDLAPVVDPAGQAISHGGSGCTRRHHTGFLRAVKQLFDPTLTLWRSGLPQGPWEQIQTVDTPDTDTERWGGSLFSYAPRWHPQLDLSADELMLSWSSNITGATAGHGVQDIDFYRPRFLTIRP